MKALEGIIYCSTYQLHINFIEVSQVKTYVG